MAYFCTVQPQYKSKAEYNNSCFQTGAEWKLNLLNIYTFFSLVQALSQMTLLFLKDLHIGDCVA